MPTGNDNKKTSPQLVSFNGKLLGAAIVTEGTVLPWWGTTTSTKALPSAMQTMTPRWNETPTTRQNVSRVRDDGSLLTFDDIIATARKPEACYSFSISVMSNPVMSLISPASIPFAFIF